MEAFKNSIDALERSSEAFIQKWVSLRDENKILSDKIKRLEDEVKLKNIEIERLNSLSGLKSNKKVEISKISASLDTYIKEIDACLVILNQELDE